MVITDNMFGNSRQKHHYQNIFTFFVSWKAFNFDSFSREFFNFIEFPHTKWDKVLTLEARNIRTKKAFDQLAFHEDDLALIPIIKMATMV